MARRQVYEIICDRCRKVETQEIKSETPNTQGKPELELEVRGQPKVVYQDLCLSCRKAVANYSKQMIRRTEKKEKELPEKKAGLLKRVTG